MAKSEKESSIVTAPEALEIIELASDDFEALARAFKVITEVIDERYQDAESPTLKPGALVH